MNAIVIERTQDDLLPPDLDRLEWHIEEAFFRMPCVAKGGVKTVYNGPICYTPDGNPLVGRAPGLDNFYLAGGGYSVHFKKQIAIAYVRPDFAEPGQALTSKMLGQHHPAIVVEESPYDPTNERLRADG